METASIQHPLFYNYSSISWFYSTYQKDSPPIFSLPVPTYCLAYMIDELAYTSMTVKVIGRQWYWVYEVETPTDDDEEEDEEDE